MFNLFVVFSGVTIFGMLVLAGLFVEKVIRKASDVGYIDDITDIIAQWFVFHVRRIFAVDDGDVEIEFDEDEEDQEYDEEGNEVNT